MQPIIAGGVYVVSQDPNGAGTRRLVMVHRAASDSIVEVCLAHSTFELATDQDLVLAPRESGLRFPLVLATDLVAPLFVSQLLTHLTSLPTHYADACRDATLRYDLRRGMPIQARRDARYTFKLAELDVLHSFSSRCVYHLLDGE